MGNILESIQPNDSALLVPLFAIALADGLSADEKASLGAFIAAVGDTITLIGVQEQLAASGLKNSNGAAGGD